MSPGIHAFPRRAARRAGVVVSLVAFVALLAGCSSGDSSSADSRVDGAGADAAQAEAAAPAVDGSSAVERSVIITGSMYMTVDDPITVADQASGIVQKAGGRIDARSETAADGRNGSSASLTMRIPSDDLEAVVDNLRKLGTVDQFTTDSYDVTTEVTDLNAKISTLRASTARIEALLGDAKDISDIITLENELDGRQATLQSLEAQQRGLDDQVSMSTIDLSLTTEPVVVVKVDDSPKTFWDGLVSGWSGLVGFISVALIVIGVLLPWLVLMGIIALAIVLPIRARNSRVARKRAASPVTPAAPGTPAWPAWSAPAPTAAMATAPMATAPTAPVPPPPAPEAATSHES